jgi:hypothetical protein
MQTAGARALREDDIEMSREAVLLQWERKIEEAERRDGGRVEDEHAEGPVAEPVPLRPAQGATRGRFERSPGPAPRERRFERRETPVPEPAPEAERRTITITGQATAPRRRRPMVDAQLAQPDRIALWAFLLGLFLVAVAAGTAHA